MTISSRLTFSPLYLVLINDWYKNEGIKFLRGKAGAKPEFTGSEMMTLMLVQEIIPFPSETQFLGLIHANDLSLFPWLFDQSQYNQRAR